ncbi:hypothetical protein GCM10023331_02700 [Algivirga pacifica]|uniref:Uncharacterized protein n=2 Tax=Algivirga pacifica TaxID=1162670 RepID=A0ABP9CY35_9BACT
MLASSCALINEEVVIDKDNLVKAPNDFQAGLPLLDGIINIDDFISAGEGLTVGTDDIYTFEETSSMSLSNLDDVAQGMGLDSFDELVNLDFSDLAIFDEMVTYEDIVMQIKPDLEVTFLPSGAASNNISVVIDPYLPENIDPFNPPSFDNPAAFEFEVPLAVTENLVYDLGIGLIDFTQGGMSVVLDVHNADLFEATVKINNLRSEDEAEVEEVIAPKEKISNTKVRYTIPLSGKVFDLVTTGASYPKELLPKLTITGATTPYMISGLELAPEKEISTVKVLFNQDADISIDIPETTQDFALDLGAMEGASITFNPNNEDLKIGMDFHSSYGIDVSFAPSLKATFSDNSVETIFLQQENDLGATEKIEESAVIKGAMEDGAMATTSVSIYEVANLLNISPEKKISSLALGGQMKLISAGKDLLAAGTEITLEVGDEATMELAAIIPIDARLDGLTSEIALEDGFALDQNINEESEVTMSIESKSEIALDLGMTFEVQTEEGIQVYSLNEGKAVIVGGRPTGYMTSFKLTAEEINALLNNQGLTVKLTAESSDLDEDGIKEFTQLKKGSSIELKGGILLHVKNGSNE